MPETRPLTSQIGALERPGQALQNTIMGDLPGAFQAMFTPQDLSIKQRDAFLKEYGLDKGPWANVFRLLTNPALIITLALSYKFPVPNAKNMFKVTNAVEAMVKRFPIMGRLASMPAIYRGTGVFEDYGRVIHDIRDFRDRYNGKMSTLLRQYRASTGALPTHKEQLMVSAWLDGLHRPLRGWEGKNGVIMLGKGASRVELPSVGTLMPTLEAKMTPQLKRFGEGMRGVLNDMYNESFGDQKNRKQIMKTMARLRGSGQMDELTETWAEYLNDPKRIEFYYPHRLLRTEEDFQAMMKAMTDSSSGKAFARQAGRKAERWLGPEAYRRHNAMMPSLPELDELAKHGLVDTASLNKLKEASKFKVLAVARAEGTLSQPVLRKLESATFDQIKERYPAIMSHKEGLAFQSTLAEAAPKQYTLKLMTTMNSYAQTMGSTYGWTIKGGGAKMMDHLRSLKELGKAGRMGAPYAKMRAEMLENTYIPLALGRGTFKNALKAQAWEQNMYQLAEWVKTPKVVSVLGASMTNTLHKHLVNTRGAFSYVNVSQKAAGYFYLSTLGLNPASALKNMFQLQLTTASVLGEVTTAQGMVVAMRKSHKYFAGRFGPKKMSHSDAIRFAYPSFGKSGVASAPLTDEALESSLQNIVNVQSLAPGKVMNFQKKISASMMSLFTASETAVRLTTWEGALIHARRAKMPADKAREFAARVVEETQFLTGPQNTPYFLLGANPLVRQLGQFPLRFLEFATHTAFNLGVNDVDPLTGKKMNVMGKNPGTFARMIAGSILALELGRYLGVDASDALVGGALPTFQNRTEGPFGGFPIVPPAVGIVGSLLQGATTGDFSSLVRSTPLLVPGGTGILRTAGLLPPGVVGDMGARAAKALGRSYADYKNPAPDGRIPVYTRQGTLKGYFSRWELVKMGLGVRSGDRLAEEELMTMLVKGRDQIRGIRKDWLDARLNNNAADANSIAERFQIQFGFPLPVSEQDVEAMQVRRRVSRLEQLVRTLPPGPVRDQYVQLIAATLGASGPALLGIDPALLGEPKPVREQFRSGGPGPQSSARQSYRTGPFDTVDPQRVGRQALPSNSKFGF
ncbi:hypothetical protein LCGC14_0330310 [marine sediment metagenome]|uniref:Large polyvalent protein associated domain-containing protein n=1 Tax=marine sediment metagenome TaxID=412755 RepID=A0A0F9WP21_9ZZZZ